MHRSGHREPFPAGDGERGSRTCPREISGAVRRRASTGIDNASMSNEKARGIRAGRKSPSSSAMVDNRR